jgi:hypothetical protein
MRAWFRIVAALIRGLRIGGPTRSPSALAPFRAGSPSELKHAALGHPLEVDASNAERDGFVDGHSIRELLEPAGTTTACRVRVGLG